MYNNDEFIKIIKGRLSEKTLSAFNECCRFCQSTCKKFGADEEKAYTAGILHDIMKEEKIDIQRDYMVKNGESIRELEFPNPLVYHQMAGAAYCRLELGIDDADILSAILQGLWTHCRLPLLRHLWRRWHPSYCPRWRL